MSRVIIKVVADDNTGEACIKTTPAFHEHSPLFRLDCIQDALYDLEELYEQTRQEWRANP